MRNYYKNISDRVILIGELRTKANKERALYLKLMGWHWSKAKRAKILYNKLAKRYNANKFFFQSKMRYL